MFRISCLRRVFLRGIILSLCITVWKSASAVGQPVKAPPRSQESRKRTEDQKRSESLWKIAQHLHVGEGSVIADIGAGNGRDTWTFADIVGATGKVLAEEIEKGKTKAIEERAREKGLRQVQAVLGNVASPSLPDDSVDMAFMHHVYHHLTQPREMLQGIWKALKPGGFLVIVDRRLGTLVDWVPREERGEKHYWIAETTVVREAREQGFFFVECAEQNWHVKDVFVLIFQRPADIQFKTPDRDPDLPSELPIDRILPLLAPPEPACDRIAFVALGEGRKLVEPILDATSCSAIDIVLEEWATQKDERPSPIGRRSIPAVLTESGNPNLGPEPIGAIYFLDSYHLLFHGPVLLAHLRQRLTANGCVYILDRQAPGLLPRREASHRRMIAPETVKQEMAQAAFALVREEIRPTGDRFLLVFKKTDGKTLAAETSSGK
ncbi:MAG: methyltransferase domain-containing protein [Pirellulales bacterium]|nr:methyltransferase domain-containing protein [Pirellulales bacterium]